MSAAQVPTTERLARALDASGAPAEMVERARAGFYDDYKSPVAMPIHQLVSEARANGLHDIAERAVNGDFDGTKEEADAWAKSPDGQAAFRELFGGKS